MLCSILALSLVQPVAPPIDENYFVVRARLVADELVIAIAQEGTDLESHARLLSAFAPQGPRFEILADLKRAETLEYDRVTSYLIDRQGKVREIFPMIIHGRAGWPAILREAEALAGSQKKEPR